MQNLNDTPNTVIQAPTAVQRVDAIEEVLAQVYKVYDAVKRAKPGVRPGWKDIASKASRLWASSDQLVGHLADARWQTADTPTRSYTSNEYSMECSRNGPKTQRRSSLSCQRAQEHKVTKRYQTL